MEKTPTLTPESFLKAYGIAKGRAVLVYEKDKDAHTSVDFEIMLERYHKAKLLELDIKIYPGGSVLMVEDIDKISLDGYPG